MKFKLNILFFLYRSKMNGRNEMPVYCRITINGKRKQFACGCFLTDDDWNRKTSKHNGLTREARRMNDHISSIRKGLIISYDALIKRHGTTDVQDLYDKYTGKTVELKTLLGVFDHHINQISELTGSDYSPATLGKFVLIRRHVSDFIKYQYGLSDMPLSHLRLGFLQDFDHYLKVCKKQNQNTVNKTIERVRKIVKIAVAHGWLSHDTFLLYRKKRFVKEVVFLDTKELALLETCQLTGRLNTVRHLFLFSCYTGLAYNEVFTLNKTHLKEDKDGNLWIEMVRQKTKRPMSVLVLPKALSLIKLYGYPNNEGLLLPVISNQKLNRYIKELAIEVGIKKHLTHHVARKTFATTVLLYNDIPIDVASFLLGHSRISTTEEFYAKVQRDRVLSHIDKLSM